MRWLRRLRMQLRPGFGRELAEELRHHQEMLRAEGESAPGTARRLGDELHLREASREIWGGVWLDRLAQDIHIGLRAMRRAPGFTALAVLILGLGIGANTALFSVVDAVLLHPLPYPNAARLAYVTALPPDGTPVSSFAAHARCEPGEVNLAGGFTAERVPAAEITPNFFSLLGVQPARGRGFLAGEQTPGKNRVVVLSDTLARRLGKAAPGSTLTINGLRVTVVGVMPPGFDFPDHAQLWLPYPNPWSFQGELISSNIVFWYDYALLRPGITPVQARQELIALALRPPTKLSPAEAAQAVTVTPLREFLIGEGSGPGTGPMLDLLLGAVGLVLLIACADVANLQLTRAVARQKEITLRAALGASRARLLRQNFTESLLLAAVGAAAGLLIATLSLPALRHLLPASFWLAAPLGLDGRVLALTAAAALLSGVVFGLFPSLHACSLDLRPPAECALPERRWLRRARGGLAITEVALAVVLLIGAGLLLQSLARLSASGTGFQPQRLLSAKLSLGGAAYDSSAAEARFYRQVLPRIAAIPGVTGAALTSQMPFAVQSHMLLALQRQEPASASPTPPEAMFSSVSPGYFRVMDIPLAAGREFSGNDTLASPHVAIVNRTLAQELWPGNNPLGRHLALPSGRGAKPAWLAIVGVVGDTALTLGAAPRPVVYLSLLQSPAPSAYAVVRTGYTASALAPAIRRAVAAVDPRQPVTDVASEADRIAASISAPRFRALLLGLFAALALLLSAAGILGAMAYWTARRTGEIGIRIALGAKPGAVLRLIVGQGMGLVACGIVLGLAAALALGPALRHFLFRVTPYDPATLLAAAALMAAIGGLACYVPARRAARLDPLAALRRE